MTEYRPAISREEKDAVYRVRYQVYCLEKHWLKAEDYPDGREIDEYDAYSVHFLAQKEDREVVGTVRAIPPSPLVLPITRHFGVTIPPEVQHYVEISRLAVVKKSRGLPVALGLLKAVFDWSIEQGITHGYAIVENDLLQLLIRLGYPFKKLGEARYYFGGFTIPAWVLLSDIVPFFTRWKFPWRHKK